MKKNRTIIPTRFLPRGARRITNANNERVWLINGKEYLSKAEYFKFIEDRRLAETTTAAQPKEAPEPEPVME